MYKACIFDLDGTIADTVESIAYVGNKTLRHFHLEELPVESYNFYAGDGADELVRRMLQAVPGGAQADYEAVRVLYRKWFGENPFYHVKPFDGILELLDGLKEQGIKIAVFSNKPHEAAVEVVERIFGKDRFHKVQGQTANIPRKPSPVGALAIAEEFQISPKECIYCGRYQYRYGYRKGSGNVYHRRSLGLSSKKELEEHHADKIVDRPGEILDFAKGKEKER